MKIQSLCINGKRPKITLFNARSAVKKKPETQKYRLQTRHRHHRRKKWSKITIEESQRRRNKIELKSHTGPTTPTLAAKKLAKNYKRRCPVQTSTLFRQNHDSGGSPQARTKLGRNSECTVLTKELNKLRKNHHKISLPQSQKKHEKKHIINFGPDFFSGIFCVFSGRILHFFLGKVFCFLRRNFQNYSRELLFFSGSFQKKILGHFEYFSGRIVKIFLGCFFFSRVKKNTGR